MNDQLKSLLAAVPKCELRIQSMGEDKPAIYAGDEAILRYRNNAEGESYARLVVAAINSLPALLAPPGSANAPQGSEASAELVGVVSAAIEPVLSLNAAFGKAQAKLLTKLLAAALEPLVNPAAFERQREVAPASASPGAAEIAAIRNEAVNDFCMYLLEHGDSHQMPSEEALLSYAYSWAGVGEEISEAH